MGSAGLVSEGSSQTCPPSTQVSEQDTATKTEPEMSDKKAEEAVVSPVRWPLTPLVKHIPLHEVIMMT